MANRCHRLSASFMLGATVCAAVHAQSAPATLPGVVVESAALPPSLRRIELDSLSNAPMAETPLSAGVIDSEDIAERGVRSLSQAIRAIPSAGDAYNTIGFPESLTVRGFRLDTVLNYRRDGLPASNYLPLAVENLESIEIVQGVASVIGGTGTPGGLVNYRLKQPTDAVLRWAGFELSERGTLTAQGDFGGRFGEGDAFGYRVNVAGVDRRPVPEDAQGWRGFLSGFFDWKASASTRFVAEFQYEASSQPSVPGYGLLDTNGDGYGDTLPPLISPRENLNSQPWSQPFQTSALAGSLRWQQKLDERWGFQLSATGQNIRTNDRIAFPDGCSAAPVYVYPGVCGNGDVDMYDYISNGERRTVGALDALLSGTAATGPVSHELRLGARYTRFTERFPPLYAYNFVGISNIFAPVTLPADPTPTVPGPDSAEKLGEISASDVMRYGPASLWLGLRWVQLEQSSSLADGTEAIGLMQRFTTPWAAIGWQPWSGGFGYLSYGQGVEIESVPNRPDQFANYGQVLPALESKQVELGFKQIWPNGSALTAALFSIDKPYGDDIAQPDGLALRVAGGRVSRHRGAELGGTWVADRSLKLTARAAWIDARTIEAFDPELVGKRTTNVAPFAAALGLNWLVPQVPGLTIGSLFNYSGAKPVLHDNSVSLPPYWQWDIAGAFQWRQGTTLMTLRVGFDNVTSNRYWKEAPTQPWGGIYLFPAQPLVARVALAAAW
jgi:iron complex outermembrane receptor protein